MHFLASLLERISSLGGWGVILFIVLYIVAAVTLAPAFLLTVAAGAIYGVWRGSAVVFVGAVLGGSAAYGVARGVSGVRMLDRLHQEPRVALVRQAVAKQGAWVQFLLRLSPLVPFNLLNYALGMARVRYRDFLLAMIGMIPAIVMYAYYGKVVGDVAKLAAGVAPPRGPEYYALLAVGVVATAAATMLITRATRKALNS
jgi:uncharacterized membrane protein YdjX (TVP38/TMEM64 family)